MESYIKVPTLQGNTFSDNNRWAECVKRAVAQVKDRFAQTNPGSQMDATWAILYALPYALEEFNALSLKNTRDPE